MFPAAEEFEHGFIVSTSALPTGGALGLHHDGGLALFRYFRGRSTEAQRPRSTRTR